MTTLSAENIDSVDAEMSDTVLEDKSEGFFELVLSEGRPMDDLVMDEGQLASTVQKLLLLSVFGLGFYGVVVGLAAQTSTLGTWFTAGTPTLWMPLAFSGAFLAAIGICLPSFYFYTQLAGLDASFRLITAQSLRVQARTSVVLLGVLPFYTALALGIGVGFDLGLGANGVVLVGMWLPFAVGLVGIAALYRSFKRLVERLPITHERRGNIMLRLVLCWGAVFSTVAPVALWRLGEFLGTVI
ncbi:hypothetical protein FIV42_17195 [Persicimonas caeni]|uniref:Uncharacterized protein n=1 Tax=Persicimonas caeni TaxID=2292766 RepID=A0A4Y6PVN3_PERCE|nr:hypothetical protein [Persicimonas caeni]QDG52414.1 hypothetical protein FIV42_17195 [Persicimonas caeni]QED33636.1 hypothetical protein FRD00_17190 [Persicimonas caeni]